MTDTTIGCTEEGKREFNALMAQHAVKTKKDYTQPEFFRLLLDSWKKVNI